MYVGLGLGFMMVVVVVWDSLVVELGLVVGGYWLVILELIGVYWVGFVVVLMVVVVMFYVVWFSVIVG